MHASLRLPAAPQPAGIPAAANLQLALFFFWVPGGYVAAASAKSEAAGMPRPTSSHSPAAVNCSLCKALLRACPPPPCSLTRSSPRRRMQLPPRPGTRRRPAKETLQKAARRGQRTLRQRPPREAPTPPVPTAGWRPLALLLMRALSLGPLLHPGTPSRPAWAASLPPRHRRRGACCTSHWPHPLRRAAGSPAAPSLPPPPPPHPVIRVPPNWPCAYASCACDELPVPTPVHLLNVCSTACPMPVSFSLLTSPLPTCMLPTPAAPERPPMFLNACANPETLPLLCLHCGHWYPMQH